MLPSPLTSSAGKWWLALLASLAVHGLLVLVFARLPGPSRVGPGQQDVDCPTFQVRMSESGDELEPVCYVTESAAAAPSPPPAPVPVSQSEPGLLAPVPAVPLAQPGQGIGSVREGSGPVGSDSGSGTGKGSTSFFQVPAQGEAIVYVIDRSASMGLHGALNAARRELLASLEQLPAAARFQVIVYNSSAAPLIPGRPDWLTATPENKRLVAVHLENLRAEGGTRHELALPTALALQPEVIFFLTDADDLREDYVRSVTLRNRGRTVIHVIELNTANRHRPDMPLHLLSRENRGLYQAIDLDGYR